MTKKRITCILLGFVAALSAVFVGVLPQSTTPAKAETTNHIADLQKRLETLPESDPDNIYIFNNVSDTVFKLPMSRKYFESSTGTIKEALNLNLFFSPEYKDFLTVSPMSLKNLGITTAYGLGTAVTSAQMYNPDEVHNKDGADNGIRRYDCSEVYSLFREPGGFYLCPSRSDYDFLSVYSSLREGFSYVGNPAYNSLSENFHWFSPYLSSYTDSSGHPVFDRSSSLMYIYLVYDVPEYVVTWRYRDKTGNLINTSEVYQKGTDLGEGYSVPAAPYSTFMSWDKLLAPVTKDIVYTAVYEDDKFLMTQYQYNGSIRRVKQVTYYTNFSNEFVYENEISEIVDGVKTYYRFKGVSLTKGGAVIDISTWRPTGDFYIFPVYEFYRSYDAETGVIIEGGGSFWDKIVKLWNDIGSVPFIGWFLQILFVILCLAIGIPLLILFIRLLILIVQGIIRLVRMIQNSVRSRKTH